MLDRNLTPEQERYVESHAPYGLVSVVLAGLLLLEYLAATRLTLGFAGQAAVLVGLAATQAALVGWYSMHLKFDRRWAFLLLVPVAFLSLVVVAGLMPDIGFVPGGTAEATIGSALP